MFGLFLFTLVKSAVDRDTRETETTQMDKAVKTSLAEWVGDMLQSLYVPVFSFVEQENSSLSRAFTENQIGQIMPLYEYSNNQAKDNTGEEPMTIEMILLAESSEEMEYDEAQDNMHPEGIGQEEGYAGLEELLRAENEETNENQSTGEFVARQKQTEIDYNYLKDYENLVKNFYTIDSTTMAGSDQLNIEKLSAENMTVSKEAGGPQILIYHTHSKEAFADSVPGDSSTTIVGAGDYLAQILTQEYGYQVLHHTGQYDVESRDDAYSKALPDIEKILEENPSIQVVIDLHRDAMPADRHLVIDIDGRPTAQFMFFNGLSRTRKTGNISYLYNENLEDNLAFSFQMQVKAAEYYPGLTRKIYLKGYRYNLHLRPRSTLIELGAQNNTVEEIRNACHPLAHILNMVLSGEG